MTCKSHTILATLRKLRDEGYAGKINPAIIREMTGIERAGSILCDLRTEGHLIDAGTILLPARRGKKTLANQYTISQTSSLIPTRKPGYQKKLRESGMAKDSKTSDIRKAIKSYGREVFTTSQVRKDIGMYKHTYQRLEYLASLGEIKRHENVKTGGRSTISWVEVEINEELIFKDAPVATANAEESNNPWAAIWPEFFMLPKLKGTLRSYGVADF